MSVEFTEEKQAAGEQAVGMDADLESCVRQDATSRDQTAASETHVEGEPAPREETAASETYAKEEPVSAAQPAASEAHADKGPMSDAKKAEPAVDVDDGADAKANSKKIYRIGHDDSFGQYEELSREDYILMRLPDEDLLEYLEMMEQRADKERLYKEKWQSRLFFLVQLAVITAGIVLVVWFLRDNPVVLVSILYTGGLLFAAYLWKHRTKDGKP